MEESTKTGRTFCLTEAQKAEQIGMSRAWLSKDRRKAKPQFSFRRYGVAIRYQAEAEAV